MIFAMIVCVAACGGPVPSAPTFRPSTGPTAATSSPTASYERPPACTAIGQTWVAPADGATLVCVPAGPFVMGSDDQPASAPRHEVRLSAFWIDRTEVTNARYERCVALGRCPPRPNLPGATGVASKTRTNYYFDPAFAEYPVLIYTPEEAIAYCTCMDRRLPTEAQ